MADLYFDRALGLLTWPAKGLSWNAVSGINNRKYLPSGLYKLNRRGISEYTANIGIPFQDKTGKGFFLPLVPLFATDRGKINGRLGIHPDGNVPGTEGCIGLTDPNTKNFYDAIGTTAPSARITLKAFK
jgi:hypothetical protein